MVFLAKGTRQNALPQNSKRTDMLGIFEVPKNYNSQYSSGGYCRWEPETYAGAYMAHYIAFPGKEKEKFFFGVEVEIFLRFFLFESLNSAGGFFFFFLKET